MKKTALLATSAIIAAGFVAADASAVDVEMYGQVNKGVMLFDDGVSTEFNVVDNDYSSTRMGVKGSQALDNGLTASVLLEMELQSNASDTLTQGSNTPADGYGANFTERHARVGLAGEWGAVHVGATSSASDFTTEQDLAGANDVLGSDVEDIGGGLIVRTAAGGNADLDSSTGGNQGLGAALDNMDGNGRANVLRYDSPIVNGFQGRASVAQGGDMDAAVFYNGRMDAIAVKGALGYLSNNDSAANTSDYVESQLSGSISAKHDNGLGGTIAYGQQELGNKTAGNDDPTFWYLKAGYSWDAFEVAVDYSQHEDIVTGDTTDAEVTVWGLGGQYNLGSGVSLAAYAKQFDVDYTGVNTDEVNVYGVNLRAKF